MRRLTNFIAVIGLLLVITVMSTAFTDSSTRVEADDSTAIYQLMTSTSDTFAIIIGDTLTRAIGIKGVRTFALHVPTLDLTTLTMIGGYDADSAFVPIQIKTDAGDSLAAFILHNGTGGFAVDLTQWVAGFNFLKFDTADTMTVLRTFHYTIKY